MAKNKKKRDFLIEATNVYDVSPNKKYVELRLIPPSDEKNFFSSEALDSIRQFIEELYAVGYDAKCYTLLARETTSSSWLGQKLSAIIAEEKQVYSTGTLIRLAKGIRDLLNQPQDQETLSTIEELVKEILDEKSY